jgi:hypothetical protein
VAGDLLVNDSLSAGGYMSLGSGVSVMRSAEIGANLSVMGSGKLLGELSIYSNSRSSVTGLARVGSLFAPSVQSALMVGSSVSLVSFFRLGSSVSVSSAIRGGLEFQRAKLRDHRRWYVGDKRRGHCYKSECPNGF